MRWTLGIMAALALLPTTGSSAPGIDLAWSQCRGKSGAMTSKASFCTSAGESYSMYASFNPPAGVEALEGCRVYVDYQQSGSGLSCWWSFSGGSTPGSALRVLPLPPVNPVTGDPTI